MPIDMPAYAFESIGVSPELGISHARTEAGLVVTSRRAEPFWRGRMTTEPLAGTHGSNEHADFRAFLSRCVDLNLRVDFVHPRHRYPSAYTAATWPMADDATLAALTDRRNIVVTGLTVGMTLKRGDRLALSQGSLIAHRWLAADVVVASAIAQALELTPRLPLGVFEAGAAVALKDPIMRLMIVPGSWDDEEVGQPAPIGFEVMESLA